MTVGRICQREVDLAEAGESVRLAAQRMAARDVGCLIVLDGEGRPTGCVTDRDLSLKVLALGRDPERTTVGEVMTPQPHSASEELAIESALALMQAQGVRRLPVVSMGGQLVGVVGLDDVLDLLAAEFGELRRLLRKRSPQSLAQG
jgi:CBS domain-containing protein